MYIGYNQVDVVVLLFNLWRRVHCKSSSALAGTKIEKLRENDKWNVGRRLLGWLRVICSSFFLSCLQCHFESLSATQNCTWVSSADKHYFGSSKQGVICVQLKTKHTKTKWINMDKSVLSFHFDPGTSGSKGSFNLFLGTLVLLTGRSGIAWWVPYLPSLSSLGMSRTERWSSPDGVAPSEKIWLVRRKEGNVRHGCLDLGLMVKRGIHMEKWQVSISLWEYC